MSDSAKTPTNCVDLDSVKQQWLRDMGLAGNEYVIDCDVTARTITFQTENGPIIRQIVEQWSRVMGYHRPVTAWNPGKQQEFKDRKMFEEISPCK